MCKATDICSMLDHNHTTIRRSPTCWWARQEGGEMWAKVRRRRRSTQGCRWRGSHQGSPCAGCTAPPLSSLAGCLAPVSPGGSHPERWQVFHSWLENVSKDSKFCNKRHLGYVNAGVVMNLGLFHNNVVLTITDVGDVTLAEIPSLDPAHIKKENQSEVTWIRFCQLRHFNCI